MSPDPAQWRVFCVASDCYVEGSYYAKVWRRHFERGLAKAVARADLPEGLDWTPARRNVHCPPEWTREGRAALSARLVAQVRERMKRGGLDCVVSYLFSSDVDPAAVREITSAGVPWVNFFCDSLHLFPLVSEVSAAASLAWFPESQAAPDYRALGVKTLCAPYAVDCGGDPVVPDPEPRWDVAFAGALHADRAERLGLLLKLGYRVRICGEGWKASPPAMAPAGASAPPRPRRAWGEILLDPRRLVDGALRRWLCPAAAAAAEGFCADEDWEPFLRGAAVHLGLNVTRADGRHVSYPKLRDFEMPGYGVCYLTQRNADLAAELQDDREVAMYSSLPELLWKLRRLLRDPDRRHALAREGARGIRARHGWRARLAQVRAAL